MGNFFKLVASPGLDTSLGLTFQTMRLSVKNITIPQQGNTYACIDPTQGTRVKVEVKKH